MVCDSIQAAVDRDEEKVISKERTLRAKIVRALAMQGEAKQLRKKLTLEYWQNSVVATGTTLKGQVHTHHPDPIQTITPYTNPYPIQVRIIKRQMTMLIDFYGLKRKRDLIAYTLSGTKFSEKEIVTQYVQLLRRIQNGKLKVREYRGTRD